jgi:AraC-like DNA-binding protein
MGELLPVGHPAHPTAGRVHFEHGVETPILTASQATYIIEEDYRDLEIGSEWYISFSLGRRAGRIKASYVDAWPAGRFGYVGDVLFIPPYQRLRSRVTEDEQRVQRTLRISVRHELVDEFSKYWEPEILQNGLDVQDERITDACLRIADEMAHPGLGGTAIVESLSVAAMINLSRSFARTDDAHIARGGLAPWQHKRLVEQLMDEASQPSLTDLARTCGTSVRHLTRSFKQQNGCTIGEYVAGARARKAQELLSDRTLTIGEVAARLGYKSHAVFSTTFRKTTGLRPNEFRRRLLAEDRPIH